MIRKFLLFLLLFSSLAQASESALVGKWEDRNGGIFSDGISGWDSCEFSANHKFECISYPKIGDLPMPFEGEWVLDNSSLVLIQHAKSPNDEYFEIKTYLEIVRLDQKTFHCSLKADGKVELIKFKKVKFF